MAQRTAFLAAVEVYPRRAPEGDRVGHRFQTMLGEDFFVFAERAWMEAPDKICTDGRYQRIYQPVDVIQHGDVLLFKADVGFYGDPGAIVNTTNREQLLEHSGEISSTTNTRLGLFEVSPSRYLMVVETARNGHLYNFMMSVLQHERDILNKRVTFSFTRVERGDEWLEKSAYLEQVHIVHERKSSDLAHRGGKVVPAKRYIFAASNFGGREEGGKMLRRLIRRQLNANDLVLVGDLPKDEDYEETQRITVTDGHQQRTFVLTEDSDPKTPSFRELIPTVSPSGIATDDEFLSFCRDVERTFSESGSM